MSPRTITLFAILTLSGLIAGCSAQAAAPIGDRQATATAGCLQGTSVVSRGESATFVLATTSFNVTQTQVAWNHKTLALPADWKNLELKQSGNRVKVLIDGKTFAIIDPTA
jgi:hypothetical protein